MHSSLLSVHIFPAYFSRLNLGYGVPRIFQSETFGGCWTWFSYCPSSSIKTL